MALTDTSTGTTMLVQPACNGYGYGNFGGGLFGGNNDIISILFIIALCNGNWGFGGGFGGSQGVNNDYVLVSDMAQLNKAITDSYSMTERKLDGINNGICSLGYDQLAQMNGINQNIANTGYNVMTAINTNGYESRFATQALGNQLATCCCDLKEGIANVNYTNAMNTNAINQNVSNGFCQTNFNNSNNTRDIITSTHADTDRIIARLDMMESNRQAERIAELQAENQGLKFAASQERQNAYLIDALAPKCPTAAYVVQPPQSVTFPTNCCGGISYASGGCGCNG